MNPLTNTQVIPQLRETCSAEYGFHVTDWDCPDGSNGGYRGMGHSAAGKYLIKKIDFAADADDNGSGIAADKTNIIGMNVLEFSEVLNEIYQGLADCEIEGQKFTPKSFHIRGLSHVEEINTQNVFLFVLGDKI
jgi:hypothetical protein